MKSHPKAKIIFLLILFLGIFGLAKSSSPAELSIPDARRIDWQGNVGVPGGIPTVTTNCTTAECNTLYSGGANVSVANINAAIASAPNSDPPYDPSRITVVRIPAGTFNLGSGGIQINRGNVILRGAGKNKTILQSSNTGYFILTNGSGGPYDSGTIVSGYTKGSTSVTLNDTSSMSVGDFINLTQDNESFMVGDNGQTNLLMQLVHVTGVNGNVVSFDPPLVYGFSSRLNPRFVHYYGIKQGVPMIGYLGIEDIKIDLSAAGTNAAAIDFTYCYAPWVKDVEIANFGELAIFTTGTVRGTVTGCYFNTSTSGREGHGVYLAANYSSGQYISGVTGWLVDNNYSRAIWATVVGANTMGSVIAYNYAYDSYSIYTDPGRDWQMQSFITQHEAHEMMDLWEGNVGDQIQNDGYHGSGSHQTLFRNWIHGLSPRSYTLNRKLIDLDRWSYWHNVIGNVLGDSTWTPEYYEMKTPQDDYSHSTIYRLGFPNMGNYWYIAGNPPYGAATNCGSEWNAGTSYSIWTQVIVSADNTVWYSKQSNNLNHPPASSPDWWGSVRLWDCAGYDDQVQATIVRHRNFDYKTNSVINCGDSTYATEGCQGVTGTDLPASLYMSAKPSWWCNESPWPVIGPDVAGYHGKIPGEIAFEGETCTLPHGDTTPPAAPTGLAVH